MSLKVFGLIFINIYCFMITVYFLCAAFTKIRYKDKKQLSENNKRYNGNHCNYFKKMFVLLILLNLLTYFSKTPFVSNSAYFTMILTSFVTATILAGPSFSIINIVLDKLYKK